MTTENTNQNRGSKDRELNVLECPLTGTVVVEAGAGTGKTYNIESLYIRLILQKEAKTSQILAVTFTEAAAKELRTRIRARLTEVRQALESSNEEETPSYEWGNAIDGELVEKLVKDGTEKKVLLDRCREALADFDAAPVFTIHGFCHRMLNDHTFESNIRYGLEMRGDPQENISEAYLNFYRKYVYGNSKRARIWGKEIFSLPSEYRKIQRQSISQDTLKESTCRLIGRDEKEIEWSADPEHDSLTFLEFLEQMEASADPNLDNPFSDSKQAEIYLHRILREAVSHVKKALKEDKERESFMTFDDLLTTMKKRLEDEENGIHFRDSIRTQFKYAFIDEFQDTDDVQNAIFRMLFRDDPAPDQLIFLIGDPKQAIYGFRNGDVFTYLDATKKDSKDAPQRFQLTSNRRSSREFIQALNAMREKRENATTEDGGFFLQRDIEFPEIRFPGDITPEKEWRLLRNGVDVKAEDDNGKHPLLNCDYLGNKDRIPTYMADEFKAMVEDRKLSLQKSGEAPRPVRYSDIAVLCRTNPGVAEIASSLRKQGIPCVIIKEAPLFETPEAKLVQKLMTAVLNPSGTPLANLIDLEGFFPRFNVHQLNYLQQQDLPLYAKLRNLLHSWQTHSFRAMFSEFLKSPMKDFLGEATAKALGIQPNRTVSEALLDRNNGEKSILSTLLQIQESLNQAVVEQRLGPEGLTKFLQQRIKNAKKEAEEYPLQRTSEENAVQLLTIHKSKGLQFPIVYVQGLLSKQIHGGLGARFHKETEDGKGMEVRFDMTTSTEDSAFQKQATLEENQEALRLFYVATTRARLLCRFLEGTATGTYGMNSTFYRTLQRDNTECLPHYNSAFPQKCGEAPLTEFLDWLKEGASDTSKVEEASKQQPIKESFDSNNIALPRGWCTCSFSSLAQGGGVSPAEGSDGAGVPGVKDANSVEEDEGESDPSQDSEDNPATGENSVGNEGNAEELAPIFRFPRGKLAGTCWHEILEFLDFQGSVESQRASLWEPMLDRSSQLPKNAPDEREARIHAFGDMLEGVLETALPDPADPSKRLGFALKDIPQDHRRSELRFFFRLKNGIRGSVLAELLDSHKIPRNTDWAPTRSKEHGWVLNGSLDLLFQSPQDGKYYILDWKTNALNKKMSGFDQDGMEKEMQEHFYHLQYLLYTVAFLHAYQSLNRDWTLTPESYDRLFGGVLYCFLRGVTKDSQDTNGFYARRPEFTLIEKLFDELQPCANPDAQ